ncbi:MAG: hypothetical protein ACXVFN_11745 [Solirubrobacteraceae bacterium]
MPGLRRLFAPAPPEPGADQVTQWRWVRSVQMRQLYVVVPLLVVVVLLGLSGVILVLASVGILAGVANALWLTYKIHRAESAGAAPKR